MKKRVETYISETLTRIEEQTRRFEIGMSELSVTMQRRNRDYTISDNLDAFKNGFWTDVPWQERDFYHLNIIKPTVRANASAIVSTNVKVDIEPRFSKDGQSRMAADVAKAIRDLKYDEQWTADVLELVATSCQVAPGCVLRVRYDEHADNCYANESAEWGEDEMMSGGRAVCVECGSEREGVEGQCAECGGECEIIEEAETETTPMVTGGKRDRKGNTVTEFIPFSELRVDGMNTQGGRLKNALWLEHHYAVPAEDQYATDMSASLRWQLALQLGLDYWGGDLTGRTVVDYVERRDLYLRSEMYGRIEVENDFEVGEFKVAAGQKLSEGTYKGEPVGARPLCFGTIGDKIIEVYPCNFKTFDEEFIYFTFCGNPSNFWGLFLTELLPMQDIINYMLTLQVFHTRRNARTTLLLDSEAFDPEDLERDIATTRPDYVRNPGEPLSNAFDVVPALTMSSEPMGIINSMMQYKGDVGGVQPTMVGGDASSQGYNTASGQMLAKNQSMMMLAPFSQSIAKGKQAWVRKQLVEAQRTWKEGQFAFLLKLNGDWTEEWIDAFLECDIDSDLIIQYIQGSEVPRTLMEREWALRQFMQDLLALQQAMGQPLNPQTASDILNKIKQYTDVDLDVHNADAELQLTDRRYDMIRRVCEGMEVPVDAPPDAVNQVALEIVTANPALHPFERENHDAAIEWLTDRIITLAQEEVPNRLLTACLTQMIHLHEAAAVAFAQKQAQMQIAAQAPAMEMQQQQEAAAREQQIADEEAQRTIEMEKSERERQMALEDEERKMTAQRQQKFDDEYLKMEREKMTGNGQPQPNAPANNGAEQIIVG